MSEYKYTEDGQKVFVVEKIAENIHRIEYVYWDDENTDAEYMPGTTTLHEGKLYASPPLPRMHEEVAKVDALIEMRKGEAMAIGVEIERLKKERANLSKVRVRGLENIMELMDKPITHFVIAGYSSCEIATPDKYLLQNGAIAHLMPSLSDDGTPSMEWTVKTEGSYSYQKAIPCFSIEEANAKALEIEQGIIDNATELYSTSNIKYWTEKGLTIPKNTLTAFRDKLVKNLDERASQSQKAEEEINYVNSLIAKKAV